MSPRNDNDAASHQGTGDVGLSGMKDGSAENVLMERLRIVVSAVDQVEDASGAVEAV
jgi:hypothetical protein